MSKIWRSFAAAHVEDNTVTLKFQTKIMAMFVLCMNYMYVFLGAHVQVLSCCHYMFLNGFLQNKREIYGLF